MLEKGLNNTFSVLIIIVPFFIIWMLDRRVKKKGALFSGKATLLQRIIALVLGLAFASVSIWQLLTATRFLILLSILAVALIGYGLGARDLLDTFQGNSSTNDSVNKDMDSGDGEFMY